MTETQDYQRVYVTPALKLVQNQTVHDRVQPVLDAARPHIEGYISQYPVSDADTLSLLRVVDDLVDTPTRRMLSTLPQYNFFLSLRKLLSVVACAAHIADTINTYAQEYQVPIPQACKHTSLHHCSALMLREAAPDLTGQMDSGLDVRALGIIRRVAEESIAVYHGYALDEVATPAPLIDYLTNIYSAAGLAKP